MESLQALLERSQARHSHLCPRQILGVRIALAGLRLLELDPVRQRRKKTLMVIAETDGCFVDGLEVTARVSVGHRTLRIEDYGKIAATFVDPGSGRAVRLCPTRRVRELASVYCPEEKRGYFAQLKGYQVIPDDKLLSAHWITLRQAITKIAGSPGQRVECFACGEEIINGREVESGGFPVCLACSGRAYYDVREDVTFAGSDNHPACALAQESATFTRVFSQA